MQVLEAPFKKSTLGPFRLEVNQTARVDIQLQVGATTETVEVTAAAPVLQTESASTGDTITSTQATAIPLRGRNFMSLTLLVPGSITPNPGSFDGPGRSFGGGRPYVNGNREQTNNFCSTAPILMSPLIIWWATTPTWMLCRKCVS